MIKANEAYHNLIMHQKRNPIKSLSTISEMIRVASTLGFEKIVIFITVKDEHRIKKSLKSAGYNLELTYAKSLPDEILLTINWNTAKFIGDTIQELNDE